MKRPVLMVFLAWVCCAIGLGVGARGEQPQPDSRLDQKVTVAAVAMPLEDLLANLSRETGVSLDLHYNLRNQKVTVLVDEQPLCVVMNNLRDLLDALWFTEKVKGETGYHLDQKYGWQQEAARLRRARQAEEERREAEFGNRVREIARTAALPREELLAMLDRDPGQVRDALVYSSWTPEGGSTDHSLPGAVVVMSGLSDAQFDAVFAGTPIQVGYNDLPMAGRYIVDQVCQWIEAHPEERLHDVVAGRDPGLLRVSFERRQCMTTLLSQGPRHCISIWLVGSQPPLSLHLTEVGEPLAAPASLGWLRSLPAALGLSEAELRQRLETTEAGRALLTPPDPAAAPPQTAGHRDLAVLYKGLEEDDVLDLELTKELGLDRRESSSVPFECMLEGAHRKGGMQLVADSYVTLRGDGHDLVPKDPDLMATVLAESFGRAWTRDGSVYRFRSQTWYDNDALDPPAWLIKRLQAKVTPQNKGESAFEFDLDDFAATYAVLTDEQIEAVAAAWCLPHPYYEGMLRVAGPGRAVVSALRLYGSVAAAQRQKLRSDGMGMADLNAAQQAAFIACLHRVFKADLAVHFTAAASMRLEVAAREYERRRGEKWRETRVTFVFTLAGGKEESIGVLLASVPVETEPEESAP